MVLDSGHNLVEGIPYTDSPYIVCSHICTSSPNIKILQKNGICYNWLTGTDILLSKDYSLY